MRRLYISAILAAVSSLSLYLPKRQLGATT